MTLSKISERINTALPGMERVQRIESGKTSRRLRSLWLGIAAPIVSLPQVLFMIGVTLVVPIAVAIFTTFMAIIMSIFWFISSIVLGAFGKLEDVNPEDVPLDMENEEEND